MPEQNSNRVRSCPDCAAPLDEGAKRCWTCGHHVASIETAETMTAISGEPEPADQIPLVDWKEPEAAAPAARPRDAVPASERKSWSLALVGGAGVLACATAFVVLQSLQPAASPQPVTTVPVAAAPARPVVETAAPPTWAGARQAAWANDGSKTIAFELRATEDVTVWMARVRPLLVVRCLYRTTEVFVATRSAASIEGQSGNHTVRLQFDDDPEVVQQWTDSTSGHELFAADSVALARRLATAQRMRFSFTPFNAHAVTAEFAVQGFDQLAPLVGGTCGWKIGDEPASTVARSPI